MKKMLIGLGVVFCAFIILAALSLTGCAPAAGGGLDSESGAIRLSINSTVAKNILPPIGLVISTYEVSGTGPFTTFGPIVVSGNTTIDGLEPGSWNVTVIGFNSDDPPIAIGVGTGSAEVVIGEVAPCPISIIEYSGTGFLDP